MKIAKIAAALSLIAASSIAFADPVEPLVSEGYDVIAVIDTAFANNDVTMGAFDTAVAMIYQVSAGDGHQAMIEQNASGEANFAAIYQADTALPGIGYITQSGNYNRAVIIQR